MDFIECEKPVREGYCSDNDCSCGLTPIPHGQGYIYISEKVVVFRADTLRLEDLRIEIDKLYRKTGEYISINSYSPILVCRKSAIKRNLDLDIAAQDAASFWNSATVPLRATPQKNSAPQVLYSPLPDQPPINLKQAFSEEVLPAVNGLVIDSDVNNSITTNLIPLESSEKKNISISERLGSTTENSQSVSVDDIVEQYASGPLAEMAKRMANDLKGNDQSATDYLHVSNSIDTKITSNTESVSIQAALRRSDTDTYNSESQNNDTFSKEPQKKKHQKKRIRNRVSGRKNLKIFLFILIPLTIVISGSIAIIMILPKKQVQSAVQPAVIEVLPELQIEPVLTRDFFQYVYSFEDNKYEGTISFKDIDNNRGIYNQDVRLKGKTVSDKVTGTFSFTEQGISFNPERHTIKILWNVEKLDPNGNRAVFFDPLLENREIARILLARKN